MTNSTASIPNTTLPTTNVPMGVADAAGDVRISVPWHRFFVDVWKKLGSGQSSAAAMAYLVLNSDGTVDMYDSATNKLIGQVQIQPAQGGTEEPQTVETSPFIFTATNFGYLLVSSGQVELSRTPGTFYIVSLVGGYFAMEPKDSIRVTWYGASPPKVIFFPYS